MYDNCTNSVNGAMGFERMYGDGFDEFDPSDADYEVDEDPCEDDYDDFDRCNCSDPGCPCGGIKYGRL